MIGGNPVLIQAAVDATRKWKYDAGPQRTNEVVELLSSWLGQEVFMHASGVCSA